MRARTPACALSTSFSAGCRLPLRRATDTKAAAPSGMAHDVFLSHSTRDKPVADAVCAALENAGIRCWVAPRDVQLGRSFAGEITRAIQQSKAMVMIFS